MPEEDAIPDFMTEVHRMVSDADRLINIYTITHDALEDLESELIPKESLELIEDTVKNLMEMKVALTALTEHTAEINDALDNAMNTLDMKKEL